MAPDLQIEGLNHTYAARLVLARFALLQRPGEHRLLLGPSGSGKTTLINVIAGLRRLNLARFGFAGKKWLGRHLHAAMHCAGSRVVERPPSPLPLLLRVPVALLLGFIASRRLTPAQAI